jgi:hypothetical protein
VHFTIVFGRTSKEDEIQWSNGGVVKWMMTIRVQKSKHQSSSIASMQANPFANPVQGAANAAAIAGPLGPWWFKPNAPAVFVPVNPLGVNPPALRQPRYVYHSTPEHWSKMLERAKRVNAAGQAETLVALFPFSLRANSSPTSKPRLWATDSAAMAQHRCYKKHFGELHGTGVMTTFRFDLHHARFRNIDSYPFMGRFICFEEAIDVFRYVWDPVLGLATIHLQPGVSLCHGSRWAYCRWAIDHVSTFFDQK